VCLNEENISVKYQDDKDLGLQLKQVYRGLDIQKYNEPASYASNDFYYLPLNFNM